MLERIGKWTQTIKVYWSNLLVYKVNFFLQVLGPMLVFLFIKLSLWTSIFEGSGKDIIGGYDLKGMLTYHLWVMIASMMTMTSSSQSLAEDIRLGKISTYLIYPFSFWEFHAANFLGRQIVQFFISIITIFVCFLLLPAYLSASNPLDLIQGAAFAILAGFFWFSLNYLLGLMAFWLEETWTLTVMAQVTTYFLSGAIIPLDLYPVWLQQGLEYLPFPYVSFVPVKTLMGQGPPFWSSMGILLIWILVVNLLARLIWRKGINLYTAAGM